MELEQIWEEALKMIEEETSPVSFATWIQPIVPCIRFLCCRQQQPYGACRIPCRCGISGTGV